MLIHFIVKFLHIDMKCGHTSQTNVSQLLLVTNDFSNIKQCRQEHTIQQYYKH
jgi:hypothetical protein